MKTAVIDIGSNSVRYCMFDGPFPKKELCSTVLADGLGLSGKLRPDAVTRTAEAVARFCTQARQSGADRLFLFATEALRAASNGAEATRRIEEACGEKVDVINGETEAKIGFWGATAGLDAAAAVLDVGGASAELVCGKKGELFYKKSLPLGCVRLRDGSGGDRDRAAKMIADAVCAYGALPRFESLLGIGGTATALAAMLACPSKYDPRRVHDTSVPKEFTEEIAARFFAGEDLRAAYPCLTENRARLIGYGAALFAAVLGHLKKPCFIARESDNMEGYVLYKNMSV